MSKTSNSQLRFDGQVVIVTGAGRGMGFAHAQLLASRGAKVVVNDLGTATMAGGENSESVAEEAVKSLRESGYEAVASTDSVATEEGAKNIVATAINTWGRVDAIIHNAALGRFTPIAQLEAEEYHRVRAVSLDGAMFLTLAAWPYMEKQKYGRLLFITSTAGLIGVPSQAAYAAAKSGMIGLARVVRQEGEENGIKANLLGVAAYTRMTQSMFSTGDSVGNKILEDWWKKYMGPEHVAAAAAYLIHSNSEVSGEIFDTKGGHIDQMFLASTKGYTKLNLTPEDVRDHWNEVIDQKDYNVFRNAWDSAHAQFSDIVAAGAEPLPQ